MWKSAKSARRPKWVWVAIIAGLILIFAYSRVMQHFGK